jgi:hypothetical protein
MSRAAQPLARQRPLREHVQIMIYTGIGGGVVQTCRFYADIAQLNRQACRSIQSQLVQTAIAARTHHQEDGDEVHDQLV